MILDLIVLAALLVSAIIAFLRGFIREVLTILGVVGGLAAAYFGGPLLSPTVRNWFDGGEDSSQKLFDLIPYDIVADAIAYGSVFIIVVIVLSVASHLLAGWAKSIGLGAVDRTFGVMFGLVRGIIIIGLLYLPVHIVIDKKTLEGWFEDSKTHFYVAATADWMMQILPESFKDGIEEKTEDAVENMADSTREKLQELDVLRSDGSEDNNVERAGPQQDDQGYGQDQRHDMNELFEDSFNE